MAELLLQKLYLESPVGVALSSPFDKLVRTCLLKKQDLNPLIEMAERFNGDCDEKRPWEYLEKQRELLGISLLAESCNFSTDTQELLSGVIKKFSLAYPYWREFQLGFAYDALNRHLAGIRPIPFHPVQTESGAAYFETGNRWSWAEIPHAIFHSELGLLWLLFGKLTQKKEWITAALKLARWHLNTLDYHFVPFQGLFAKEEGFSLLNLLTMNYLLFHFLALENNDPKFEYVSQTQMALLKEALKRNNKIPSYAVVLEFWLSKVLSRVSSEKTELSPIIFDQDLSLVGYRSPKQNVIFTMMGGKTGLGCIRSNDIEIASYGPQHLPLGDCMGFGIESGPLSKRKKALIEVNGQEFCIKDTAKLASQNIFFSSAQFGNGAHPKAWIEAKQQFKQNEISIDARFLSLEKLPPLAFTFFVKAKKCVVEDVKTLIPRSLNRYQDVTRKLLFEGTDSSIEISYSSKGEMQVIPLAGGDNYWGADFLVAYLLNPEFSSYSWKIKI